MDPRANPGPWRRESKKISRSARPQSDQFTKCALPAKKKKKLINLLSDIFKKVTTIQGWIRPLGFQEIEAPRFPDNRHINVVRLSASRLYAPGNIPDTHFC